MNNFGITTDKYGSEYYLDYACKDAKVHFRHKVLKLIWQCLIEKNKSKVDSHLHKATDTTVTVLNKTFIINEEATICY